MKGILCFFLQWIINKSPPLFHLWHLCSDIGISNLTKLAPFLYVFNKTNAYKTDNGATTNKYNDEQKEGEKM